MAPRSGGYDAQTIYHMLHDGDGAESTTERARQGWEVIASRYTGVRAMVRQGLSEARVAFVGPTGDAIGIAVAPLEQHADVAQEAARSTANAIESQGQDFATAQNSVEPGVSPEAEGAAGDGLLPQTDIDQQRANQQAADEHNRRVLDSYGDGTDKNVSALPEFGPPPTVTANTGGPALGGAPVGGFPGGSAVGPGGGTVNAPFGTAPGPTPGGSPAPSVTGAPAPGGVPGPGGGAVPRGPGVVPAAFPVGPGGQGQQGANRWRRTVSPGLYGNANNRAGGSRGSGGGSAARGGGSGSGGARGSTSSPGRPAPGLRPAGPGVSPSGTPGAAAGPGGAARPGTPLAGAPVGGGRARERGEDDTEHSNRFLEPTDEHWGDGAEVAPAVIGDHEPDEDDEL